MSDYLEKAADKATNVFKGKIVERIRYLSTEEMREMMWYNDCPVIEFTDGSNIIASVDYEGNGPGVFFTSEKEIPTI